MGQDPGAFRSTLIVSRSQSIEIFTCLAVIAIAPLVAVKGQPSPAKPEFEVASVRLSPPGGRVLSMKGGPGSDDPARVNIQGYPLESLILTAYGIETFEISGPDWLIGNFGPGSVKVDIVATMPSGTTKHQFELMLQEVLEKRFGLIMHIEKKETPMYELGLAKKSAKFFPSKIPTGEEPVHAQGAPVITLLGADGFPILSPRSTVVTLGNRTRMHEPRETMEQLARLLSRHIHVPVKDVTGLQGEYDIDLFWGGSDGDPDQIPLEQAVQDQLGLKLSHSKGLADSFVVDNINRVPTEN
jgi:uncharacterized protein (TIGR03435 family)